MLSRRYARQSSDWTKTPAVNECWVQKLGDRKLQDLLLWGQRVCSQCKYPGFLDLLHYVFKSVYPWELLRTHTKTINMFCLFHVHSHVKQTFTRQGFNIATLHNKIQQEAEQIARNPGKDDILARSWPALQCGNSLLSRFQTWLTPTAKKMFPKWVHHHVHLSANNLQSKGTCILLRTSFVHGPGVQLKLLL